MEKYSYSNRILHILLLFLLIVIVFPIFTIIATFFTVPIINNVNAACFSNELKKQDLPNQTEIVEVISGCGNTSGTGNHLEIWAAILLKTTLTEKEFQESYKYSVHNIIENGKSTRTMSLLGKRFQGLENISDYEGYYIIESEKRVENTFLRFFDLRGY